MFVGPEMASCTTQRSLLGKGGVDGRCSVQAKVLTRLDPELLFPVPLGQHSSMGSAGSCPPCPLKALFKARPDQTPGSASCWIGPGTRCGTDGMKALQH